MTLKLDLFHVYPTLMSQKESELLDISTLFEPIDIAKPSIESKANIMKAIIKVAENTAKVPGSLDPVTYKAELEWLTDFIRLCMISAYQVMSTNKLPDKHDWYAFSTQLQIVFEHYLSKIWMTRELRGSALIYVIENKQVILEIILRIAKQNICRFTHVTHIH